MTVPPPSNSDETVRILLARPGPAGPPPPRGRLARRLVLGGAAALLVGGLGVYLLSPGTPAQGPQRLGPRRLVPPLLRTTLRGEGVIYALARRSEQDAADPPDAPAPRERLELLAFGTAGLDPRFAVHLASVPLGGMADAGLIAEQGATIWLWLDGLGAVSAVDGQVLADTDGLAELNPALAEALGTAMRRSFRTADALVLEGGPVPRAWRFDPRDFLASAANLPPPRPLPQINPGAAHGPGGATAFRIAEALVGTDWLALPAETAKLAAPLAATRAERLFLPAAAMPSGGGGQQMWHGAVRMGSVAPPGWPANLPNRWGQAEQVVDLSTVPGTTGLAWAGFLTAGTETPLALTGPPGLLVLAGPAGEALTLTRVGADGRPTWRAALSITRLRSVLPGPRHLVLEGWAGEGADAPELLVAIATDDGALRSLPFNA
ncbi:hypothetical protein AAFN86_20005 [Roseomonas sp. CAU 1739]|uniref:hypothetical protein n=1 Tax=Roseomonas sp. CAU 1739 TaxID=3140364 RepID=UPI00325B1DB6